eukprot:430541_1
MQYSKVICNEDSNRGIGIIEYDHVSIGIYPVHYTYAHLKANRTVRTERRRMENLHLQKTIKTLTQNGKCIDHVIAVDENEMELDETEMKKKKLMWQRTMIYNVYPQNKRNWSHKLTAHKGHGRKQIAR